jgi:hypothetical protein
MRFFSPSVKADNPGAQNDVAVALDKSTPGLAWREEIEYTFTRKEPSKFLPSEVRESFCQKAQKCLVTTFVNHAYKRRMTDESACEAYLYQPSGVAVRSCLPSRLSRVRVPSPALLPKPFPSWRLGSQSMASKQ